MPESIIKTPNHQSKKTGNFVRYGAAVLATLGLGAGFRYAGEHFDPFVTNLRVPAKTQPHLSYTVKPGDTESSIAANFGHADDLVYENMLNNQLPKSDQPTRSLQPGEQLEIPTGD